MLGFIKVLPTYLGGVMALTAGALGDRDASRRISRRDRDASRRSGRTRPGPGRARRPTPPQGRPP